MSAPEPAPTPAPQSSPHVVASIGTTARKDILNFLRKWILFPLLGALLSAVLIGRLINVVMGPGSYKVYIIGNITDPGSKEMVEAFTARAGQLSKLNQVPVEVKKLDDRGDPDMAERIAKELAARNDTLLVVGHLESTPTQKALPFYLQANPAVPVILTTETNPNLLPPLTSNRTYYPVFRLSATDQDQARTAAAFAVHHGGTSFWVVEDTDNPVYSSYLAHEFVKQVHQSQSAKVLLWSNNFNIPPAYAIDSLGINWVFFAGEWQDALILIRQLKAMPKMKQVSILLSDWCVDGRLLQDGGTDLDGVYLTHPLPAQVYDRQRYTSYGTDASMVIQQLLQEGDQQFRDFASAEGGPGYLLRRVLGLRRVSDARRVLFHVMQVSANQHSQFNLSGGNTAVFNGDGTRANAVFEVWQVHNGTFTAAQ